MSPVRIIFILQPSSHSLTFRAPFDGAFSPPPNKRLKLTGRGGRLSRGGVFSIAAAAARSLRAIREAARYRWLHLRCLPTRVTLRSHPAWLHIHPVPPSSSG